MMASKKTGAGSKTDVAGASESKADSPNDALAKQIVAKLAAENLIAEADGGRLLAKLAAGTLSKHDWKLAFENELERRAER